MERIEKSDKELKIIRIDNAAEANLMQVLNIQPNVQSDENFLEENYTWAKSALGITDSYQGNMTLPQIPVLQSSIPSIRPLVGWSQSGP